MKVVLFYCLLALCVTGTDVADLPDDIKKIFQQDALHLYKYAESPIAPILNLTQTKDFFPSLRKWVMAPTLEILLTFVRLVEAPVVYTMPQNRYLTLSTIRERQTYGNVVFIYNAMGPECQDVGLYYYGGGQDDQVLPIRAGDPAVQHHAGEISFS